MGIKLDTFSSAGGAGTDNLDDVTTRGATTTNSITVGGVTIGTEYSLPSTDASAPNQFIKSDGSGNLSFAALDITGGLVYKGAFNATAGTPSIANAEQGDFYVIDTAGTIYGQTWAVGDHLLINEDMGGSITNSKIDKVDNTDQVTSVNGNTGAVVLSGDDLAADHTATNYTAANANIDGHLSGIDTKLGTVSSPTLDDVTTNGSTTTNNISVGQVTVSGDVLANADASRTIGAEATRFITYHGDMNGAIRFKAKNNQGASISKGQAVFISGVSGTVPEVQLAQANSAATMPAFGLALANANDQAEVQVITFGNLTDYNTTTYSLSANDTVFVSAATAGALTNTAPTGEANLIQNIGRVVRADATEGIIKVGGAGRSNATPNLNEDKIFLGNASNQAVSTALSAIDLSSFDNTTSGFITSSDLPTASETVAGIIEIATNAEADAATATDKALVPSNISSLDLSDMNNTTSAFISDITSENLGDLSDVTITGAATGEYLRYSGAAWVDASLEVSDDTTPQLGGNLDTNSNEIVTASNANLILRPNGTGAIQLGGNTNPAELRLYCESSDAHYVALKSPTHSQLSGGSVTWRLPTADASSSGDALVSDGAGNLSFTTISGGGGYTYATASGATNAQANYHYSCTTTMTLTLPTSGITAGEEIRVKNMGTGTITIDRNGVLIDGIGSDYTLDVQYSSVTLVYTGTNYEVV